MEAANPTVDREAAGCVVYENNNKASLYVQPVSLKAANVSLLSQHTVPKTDAFAQTISVKKRSNRHSQMQKYLRKKQTRFRGWISIDACVDDG